MRDVRVPLESRLLLRAASLLVPGEFREAWRREWDGEVWWWISTRAGAARTLGERLALAMHCSGAVRDGFCLWLEDGRHIARVRSSFGGPGAILSGALALTVLIGVLSGGFEQARRALRPSPWERSAELALLSQTTPFMGQRSGVPPHKVVDWDRRATSLQGAAVYWWAAGAGAVPRAEVGARFFALLGTTPQLGRLFDVADAEGCQACAVVSHAFWKGRLGADAAIAGRTITVDGQRVRVLGVLQEGFWFPGGRAEIWSLFDERRSRPGMVTGAVARLRPGVTPAAAGSELRTLASRIAPPESGGFVTVNPIEPIVKRPIRSLGWLFLMFTVLAVVCAAAGNNGWKTVRSSLFFVAQSLASLLVLFTASFEFGGTVSITDVGGTTMSSAAAFFVLMVLGCLAMDWAWRGRRKRCPRCLYRLTSSIRIGEGSRQLLEPGGIEMVCPHGHGTLFTIPGDSVAPRNRWYPLDRMWCDDLAPASKPAR